jgi:uroporphyrinogen III methyltransferase/synthase
MSASTETPPPDAQPLAGRTVVITRALAQSAEFAAELERYGARVVACPTIEITAPESYAPLDEAIENLYGYDWVIFTSVNGVDYFLKRLTELGRDTSEMDELRVCSIGEATAVRLRDAQIHVDVVPEQFKAEGVFDALINYLGGVGALYALNVLIPRAAVARDYLPLTLEGAGARVDTVAVYRTVRPETSERGRIEALLAGGAVDCITFTSASTINNFAQLFDTDDLSQLLDGVQVACIGDITAGTAAEHNLRVHIQPTEHTTTALARAIAAHYEKAQDRTTVEPRPCP